MRHCGEEVSAVVLQVQTVRGGAGKCTRCGRPLRDPVSVQRGMGPVCAGRVAADAANQAAENGVIITVDGRPLDHIVYHSPTGMEWGYGGSGPADLALSILADYLGEQAAVRRYLDAVRRGAFIALDMEEPISLQLHQAFKWEFVARFARDAWRLTDSQIVPWLLRQGVPEVPSRSVVYEGRRAA